jgi:hypothetical protein
LCQFCSGFALTAGKHEWGFVVMQFHHEKEVDLCHNGSRH